MRFEYFRDNSVALEAFKADQADWIAENSAKQWATAYDFPAVADKRVIKEVSEVFEHFPTPGAVATTGVHTLGAACVASLDGFTS